MKNFGILKRLGCVLIAAFMMAGLFGCAEGAVSSDDASGKASYTSASATDENGRAVAICGSPEIDGSPDNIWQKAGWLYARTTESSVTEIKPQFKLMWDDENLYILAQVTDSDVGEGDGVTVFFSELGIVAPGYDEEAIGTFVSSSGVVSGTNTEITVAASELSAGGEVSGYQLEIALPLEYSSTNESVLRLELSATDCTSDGTELGRVNLLNKSLSDLHVSDLKKVVLSGREGETVSSGSERLEALVNKAESIIGDNFYLTSYIVRSALETANAALSSDELSEIESATAELQTSLECLYDGSEFPDVSELEASSDITDPFTFLDGTYVDNADDWVRRSAEIKAMYQYYMYGIWRDGSDEELTYVYDESTGSLTIAITRISTEAETQFTATVQMPDESITAPDGGYPVMVGMHQWISEDTANKNGYATITLDWYGYTIASDDTNHTGAFYDLYPYDSSDWREQTGVLMAWSWGCSKILDALEAGLGEELNISCENTAVTGVSRWGKSTTVCGVFEERFKLVMPSCSGAGGVALFRYTSEGNTYDFSSKGGSSSYTYTQNEPLSSLQASGEVGWFNERFKEFKSVNTMPFDQHLLLCAVADPDRYVLVIGSCIYEDWVNAPSMWYSYLAAKELYEYLGIEDHLAINIHLSGHAVLEEDVEYMTDYFDYHVYGIEPELDLDDLYTSVFALDKNADSSMDNMTSGWME